jgi:hypothetical protein
MDKKDSKMPRRGCTWLTKQMAEPIFSFFFLFAQRLLFDWREVLL